MQVERADRCKSGQFVHVEGLSGIFSFVTAWVVDSTVSSGMDLGSPRAPLAALAETINGLFKAEVIHWREPWRGFEAAEYATLEWVDWFNNRLLLEPIGNIPPAEAEANFYAALEIEPLAAQ